MILEGGKSKIERPVLTKAFLSCHHLIMVHRGRVSEGWREGGRERGCGEEEREKEEERGRERVIDFDKGSTALVITSECAPEQERT